MPPGTWAIPSAAIRCGAIVVMSAPSNDTDPPLATESPETARSTVDFPAPLVPSSATKSPSAASMLTPNNTCTGPYDTSIARMLNNDPS